MLEGSEACELPGFLASQLLGYELQGLKPRLVYFDRVPNGFHGCHGGLSGFVTAV